MPEEYKKPTNYRLKGVLIHFGGGNGGHKIAVCEQLNLNKCKISISNVKHKIVLEFDSKKWKIFNDDYVSDMDENYISNNEANILLYEQI